MWRVIDKEMTLKDCNIFCYAPEEDPYDGEEGAIWRFNYFFFNKSRKRVCHFYLRGLSIISSRSPGRKTPTTSKRSADIEWDQDEPTSSKRARYWLGDRAAEATSEWADDDDEDDLREDEGLFKEDAVEDDTPQPAVDDEPRNQMVFSPDGATTASVTSPSSEGRSPSESTIRAISSDAADHLDP